MQTPRVGLWEHAIFDLQGSSDEILGLGTTIWTFLSKTSWAWAFWMLLGKPRNKMAGLVQRWFLLEGSCALRGTVVTVGGLPSRNDSV